MGRQKSTIPSGSRCFFLSLSLPIAHSWTSEGGVSFSFFSFFQAVCADTAQSPSRFRRPAGLEALLAGWLSGSFTAGGWVHFLLVLVQLDLVNLIPSFRLPG